MKMTNGREKKEKKPGQKREIEREWERKGNDRFIEWDKVQISKVKGHLFHSKPNG